MNKKTMIFTIFSLVVFLFCLPAEALWDGQMKKGMDYYDAMMYEKAIEKFEKVLEDDPKMVEAHYLLGMSYLKLEDGEEAQKSFQRAVAMDIKYNHKINKAIRYINAKQITALIPYFDAAIESEPAVKQTIIKEVFTQAQQSIASSDYDSARRLFNLTVYYDNNHNKTTYNFLVKLGNNVRTTKAVILYNMALAYTQGKPKLQENVGFKFLKLAAIEWPKSQSRCNDLKRKAAELIGQDKVQEIFPPPKEIVTFEKTYNYDDAFEKEYGQIHVIDYRKVDIRTGDTIEIIARIKGKDSFDGKEIAIWLGKDFNPKWTLTQKGYYVEHVKKVPTEARYFGVSLVKRKDVEVTARVKRIKIPKPNFGLINKM